MQYSGAWSISQTLVNITEPRREKREEDAKSRLLFCFTIQRVARVLVLLLPLLSFWCSTSFVSLFQVSVGRLMDGDCCCCSRFIREKGRQGTETNCRRKKEVQSSWLSARQISCARRVQMDCTWLALYRLSVRKSPTGKRAWVTELAAALSRLPAAEFIPSQ